MQLKRPLCVAVLLLCTGLFLVQLTGQKMAEALPKEKEQISLGGRLMQKEEKTDTCCYICSRCRSYPVRSLRMLPIQTTKIQIAKWELSVICRREALRRCLHWEAD